MGKPKPTKSKKSLYLIQTWRSKGKGGSVKYHSHLCCLVPKLNIISSSVHASRSGRWKHVQKLKALYPGIEVQPRPGK